jgi:hypothetical protein
MICPTTLNSLDSKLHYMSVRAVADAVKVWVNEAIVPDRHYKPPPRRGADKEQRNASKVRRSTSVAVLPPPPLTPLFSRRSGRSRRRLSSRARSYTFHPRPC